MLAKVQPTIVSNS